MKCKKTMFHLLDILHFSHNQLSDLYSLKFHDKNIHNRLG